MKKILIALASFIGLSTLSFGASITIQNSTGGGGGSGTVTSVSGANGITVTNPTTTPVVSVNFVSLSTQVTGSLPAASVAAGSLGASVLASSFPVTGVTAGSYTSANITVNAQGILTSAANGSGSGTSPLYAFNGPVTDFISASTGTIVATTGVLPALAAGKCMSFKYVGYSNQNTSVNYKVWYSTAPNVVGFTVAGSSMGVSLGGISPHDIYFTGLICNQPGVQNAQRMMAYPLYSNVIGIGSYPDFYQTASVDATSTNLQVAITVDSASSGILGETLQFVVAPMNY